MSEPREDEPANESATGPATGPVVKPAGESVGGVADRPATGLRYVHLGFGEEAVDYQEAWQEQRRVHAARFAGEIPDTCLLLEHPAVYTAGRRTQDSERPLDGTPVVDVDRGGKITWHGPGQLVGYPIVKLPRPVDVVAHVRRLEEALIRTAAEFGLETTRVEGRSGVWVLGDPVDRRPAPAGLSLDFDPRLADEEFDPRLNGPEYAPSNAGQRREDRKLAAIGIRVAKGVTMHGFALNVNPDNTWFDRIVPCGIRDAGVASLSEELGREITIAEVLPVVERHLREVLEGADPKPREIVREAPRERSEGPAGAGHSPTSPAVSTPPARSAPAPGAGSEDSSGPGRAVGDLRATA
ncbi:hypothetical protein GCM10009654_29670 [Streptomyces hebeiensis]|uniref:Octanoyltransferase n=1 Tax=Streptomyces hebeiensis TaxID=229486 RepID=A0ABN1UUI6_9ACTN